MKQYIGSNHIHFKSIDSTNTYALSLLKNQALQSGTIITADYQNNGKGQRSKKWVSEKGDSFLVSIVGGLSQWNIDSIISLNHVVSISIVKIIQTFAQDVAIKWPNDIMVANKKITGILIEGLFSQQSHQFVVGFGINVNQTKFNTPRSTSLYLHTHQKMEPISLLPLVIKTINKELLEYHKMGQQHYHQLYNYHLWKKNRKHLFSFSGKSKYGKIHTTTPEGQLAVEINGKLSYFSNGEVSY